MTFATTDGTQSNHLDFPNLEYNQLGKTNLYVSDAGIGTYRMSYQNEDHKNAFSKALLSGLNLIDTSSNYMEGDSERLVYESIKESGISRDKLVIVTKAGYCLSKNLGQNFEHVVSLDDQMCHCLDPKFIKTQITQSLERMNLTTIDVFLIHNPEYLLIDLKNQGVSDPEKIFYSVISDLFNYLESEVSAGRIQHYGISSNTFVSSTYDEGFVDFSKCLSIAETIGSNHHFSVVQFPFNILECEAAFPNGFEQSLLKMAEAASIGVLTNRPLNAFFQDTFIHLKNVAIDHNITTLSQVEATFETVSQYENAIINSILKKLTLSKDDREQLFNQIAMSGVIHGLMDPSQNYDTFRNALIHYALPKVEIGINIMMPYIDGNEEGKDLLVGFYKEVNHCFDLLSSFYKLKKEPIVNNIKTNLFNKVEMNPHTTLSQMSFSVLRQTFGVSSVLVGLRHTSYVEDIITECESSKFYEFDDKFWFELYNDNKNILTDSKKENTI